MKLKLGYKPALEKSEFGIWDTLDYVSDAYCDYEYFYCRVKKDKEPGHHSVSIPAESEGLKSYIGSKGLKQVKDAINKKRLGINTKATWEFLTINADDKTSITSMTLVIENNNPILHFKTFDSDADSDSLINEGTISLYSFKNYYEINNGGSLNCFTQTIYDDLVCACEYFDLIIDPLKVQPKILTEIRKDNESISQLIIDIKLDGFQLHKWRCKTHNSNNIFLFTFPLTKTNFLEKTDSTVAHHDYDWTSNFLKSHLSHDQIFKRRDVVQTKGKSAVEVEEQIKHVEPIFMRHSAYGIIKSNIKAGVNFTMVENEAVNPYTFNFEQTPIDDDIHLYKQIGTETKFEVNNHNLVIIINGELTSFHLFKQAIYLIDAENIGKELAELPNSVINHFFTILSVFESKTKILIEFSVNNSGKFQLYLLDKESGLLESRKI